MSSVGNEQSVPSQLFSVTASSQLDSRSPDDSFLYGPSSWCSNPTASSPQYLQFDFGKVVTVSGIATQGDAVDNKWVTEYAVVYGYDEQSWLDYDGGQVKCCIKDSLITYVNILYANYVNLKKLLISGVTWKIFKVSVSSYDYYC